jgi:hypothetical protein
MVTAAMIVVPPRDGMRNGGGAVLEVLLVLTALGAATLSVLAVMRPAKPKAKAKEDEGKTGEQ